VGDKVGNVHVWGLIDNEPKLMVIEENILEVSVHSKLSNKIELLLIE
jgi:hypothetical protein